jgi:predicted methyltransferase
MLRPVIIEVVSKKKRDGVTPSLAVESLRRGANTWIARRVIAAVLPALALGAACQSPAGGNATAQPPVAHVPSAGPGPAGAPDVKSPLSSSQPLATTTAVLPEPVRPEVTAAVNASDRDPADRQLDAGRKPLEMLQFVGIAKGMRAAELGAGGGYTTELLARVVGSGGVVFGQNSAFILQRFAEQPWSARLEKPILRNVVRVDREFDEPLPPEATQLDVVLTNLFYHDTVWFKVDRARMNRAIYQALKPGGVYVVIDHSARPGDGTSQAESLHRIEESVVLSEVQQVGFQLDVSSDFLRNPADTRDWNTSPRAAGERRGSSDRFALRFRKPLLADVATGAAP